MSADERTLGERVEAVRLALSTDLFQDGLLRAMVSQEAAALLLEQQAEIERLTANEAERVRVFERDGYSMMPRKLRDADEAIDELTTERDSLRRDLEAARGDAERYRHIKAEWAIVRDFFPNRWHISTPYIYGDSFDAAIDLARARGEGNADE